MSHEVLRDAFKELTEKYFGNWKEVDNLNLVYAISRKTIFGLLEESRQTVMLLPIDTNFEYIEWPKEECDFVIVSRKKSIQLLKKCPWKQARVLTYFGFIQYLTEYEGDIEDVVYPRTRIYIKQEPLEYWLVKSKSYGEKNILIVDRKDEVRRAVLNDYRSILSYIFKKDYIYADLSDEYIGDVKRLLYNKLFFLNRISQNSKKAILKLISYRLMMLVDNADSNKKKLNDLTEFTNEFNIPVFAFSNQEIKNWHVGYVDDIMSEDITHMLEGFFQGGNLEFVFYPNLEFLASFENEQELALLKDALSGLKSKDIKLNQDNFELCVFHAIWLCWKSRIESLNRGDILSFVTSLGFEEFFKEEILDAKELVFLNESSVSRLSPNLVTSYNQEFFESIRQIPFLSQRENITQIRNHFLRYFILADFIVSNFIKLVSQDNKRLSIVHELYKNRLQGPNSLLPIIGMKPFNRELIEIVVKRIGHLSEEEKQVLEAKLNDIIRESRHNSFYSSYPWRYLAGNCLSLLIRISAIPYKADYSYSRIAGVNFYGLVISGLTLTGSFVPDADFRKADFDWEQLSFCYIDKSKFDSQQPEGFTAYDRSNVDSMPIPAEYELIGMQQGFEVDPVAIGELVTTEDFNEFTENKVEFSKNNYLDDATAHLDSYYLNALEYDASHPVSYIGMDAALAYCLEKNVRLPTLPEWFLHVEGLEVEDQYGEWLWGPTNVEIGNFTKAKARDKIKDTWFPKSIMNTWLGIVARSTGINLQIDRIFPFNCNEDVSFRVVFDYSYLIKLR